MKNSRIRSTLLIVFLITTLFSTSAKCAVRLNGADSVIVSTITDHKFDPILPPGYETKQGGIEVTGHSKLTTEDAKLLLDRIYERSSYGSAQAVTPVYDVQIIFYKKGSIKALVEICMYTNNLYASFPLKVQRQGECMCKGKGGYCCTKGGISSEFKHYLTQLLLKYKLPVDVEMIELTD